MKVPFNEARYGRDYCGGIVCNNTWYLVRDSLAYWVQGQLDQGQTMAQINAYLASYDKQDRYDSDGDGNFDEPDGFIDHFQIVHAGGDQAAGDPNQGTDAIWSHRWYAALYGGGPNGYPGVPVGQGGTSSGVTIPSHPTDTWVGDYTIQPENGGLGVFAHEFGHDLGLPDLYDTSGNTGGAENETAFWTLMSLRREHRRRRSQRDRRRPDQHGRLGEVPARVARVRDVPRWHGLLRDPVGRPQEGQDRSRARRLGRQEG